SLCIQGSIPAPWPHPGPPDDEPDLRKRRFVPGLVPFHREYRPGPGRSAIRLGPSSTFVNRLRRPQFHLSGTRNPERSGRRIGVGEGMALPVRCATAQAQALATASSLSPVFGANFCKLSLALFAFIRPSVMADM